MKKEIRIHLPMISALDFMALLCYANAAFRKDERFFMNTIIVGAGKVGMSLAASLVKENHDITVVDINPQVIQRIVSSLDVMAFEGNGATYDTLAEVGVENCSLFIATTPSDEVNILCCMMAHSMWMAARSEADRQNQPIRTVARVRNPEHHSNSEFLQQHMGISYIINPERLAAQEIARMLHLPSAKRVEMFVNGKAEMVAVKLPKDSPFLGVALKDMREKLGIRVLICAVERDGHADIPAGEFVPQEEDTLYIMGAPSELMNTLRQVHLSTSKARSTMIVGGSRTAYYLAGLLDGEGVDVKILERDPSRARELAQKLSHATVITGDASNHHLLLEEGVEQVESFVSLTGLDEANILSAIYASQFGAKKVIAKVNNEDLLNLTKGTTLESTVSTKTVTVNHITRFARSLEQGMQGKGVRTLYKLIHSQLEVLEFRAEQNAPYIGITLKELKTRPHLLLAAIVRNRKVIIPGGADMIMPDDSVLIVTGDHMTSLADILG